MAIVQVNQVTLGYPDVMKLWGVSRRELDQIVQSVSKEAYGGNIVFNKLEVSNCVTFTLRVVCSKKVGASISPSGRRSTSLCWHGHRDVMWELFHRFPEARLKSWDADYHGVAEFLLTHATTGEAIPFSSLALTRRNKWCECGKTEQSSIKFIS